MLFARNLRSKTEFYSISLITALFNCIDLSVMFGVGGTTIPIENHSMSVFNILSVSSQGKNPGLECGLEECGTCAGRRMGPNCTQPDMFPNRGM